MSTDALASCRSSSFHSVFFTFATGLAQVRGLAGCKWSARACGGGVLLHQCPTLSERGLPRVGRPWPGSILLSLPRTAPN